MENILDDIELNLIDENLYTITEEVKQNLQDKYLSDELCKKLTTELNSHECINLDIFYLSPIVELVLKNKYAVNYLYNNYYYFDKYQNKKINIFKNLYDELVIKKKKNFINFTLVNDFALSWLHIMYH